jgi:chromate reductase, NAD(P)H dehydrogenase (quinone)
MTTHKVGYLIGSLAKGSINRKLAKALVRLAPPELEMSEISFKDLPLTAKDTRPAKVRDGDEKAAA